MKKEKQQTDAQSIGNNFAYIRHGIQAQGHTPIYKMHKYFARRPHNVFRYLIESYTKPGETVLDLFCGGGVTLFEGLSTNRKVIAVDINPLATFISECQTTPVSIEEYQHVLSKIHSRFKEMTIDFYSTPCRNCGNRADVRWYELAYTVRCRRCNHTTVLSNDKKRLENNKPVNGQYICQHCGETLTAIDTERVGYELLSVTYRCPCTPGRVTSSPVLEDTTLLQYFEENFDLLINKYDLWYPQNAIPSDWDRQAEDGLNRKSVNRFADFYTKRSLFFNSFLLKQFQGYKGQVTESLYKLLLFTFSAILRHTNNMTISTGNWMDGRPASWAKHAFWIPNQFVEVNPLEYLEKRQNAVVSGLKYQAKNLKRTNKVNSFSELQSSGTHILWTRSSSSLPIPDNSVDAIVTDPPYGSNVQYGELSHYWLVWLHNELDLNNSLFALNDEILVHRKVGKKDYRFYLDTMRAVFLEGYRVLKPNGIMAFTFNNRDVRAWFAVIKAAIDAGFYLDPRGVIYQESIENYRNTAHTRYAGSLHGDFIYSFRKVSDRVKTNEITGHLSSQALQEHLITIIARCVAENPSATISELYEALMAELIPVLVVMAEDDNEFVNLFNFLKTNDLESFVTTHFELNTRSKIWFAKNGQENND